MKEIQNSLDNIIKQFNNLKEENANLRAENKLLQIDTGDLASQLVDEDVVLNKDGYLKELIANKITSNLVKKNKRALLVAVADASGSMGLWEKYIGRAFVTWATELLKVGYSIAENRFILHDVAACEVESEEFFTKGKSGGTIVNSGLQLANQIIEKYSYEDDVDVFVIYVSDGDNLSSDNARVNKLLHNRLLHKVKLFTYLEVNQYNRHSTLLKGVFSDLIGNEKVQVSVVKSKLDVKTALDSFKSNLAK